MPGIRAWLATLSWLAAFVFSLLALGFTNDHFGRISPARQIARYGELPFRDFLDPAYFLTEFTSAGMQRLLGDNLLGEWLLTSAFIAGGAVVALLLAQRASGSYVAAFSAATLALLSLPRAYDYEKFLFCPLGLLLTWRYIDRQRRRDVALLAVGLVVGALYRYDIGVYIGCAALVAIAVAHAGHWRLAVQRAGLFIATVACLTLPILVLLSYTAGLTNVVDQVVTYGRRETARTRITEPPRFSVEESREPQAPPAPGRTVVGVWTVTNANAFLYYLLRWLPLVASLVLVLRTRSSTPPTLSDAARLASLIVMCVLLNIFILRDPVQARVGGMAGPAAVLAAWLGHTAWRARAGITRSLLRVAVLVVLALTIWSVSASMEWDTRLTKEAMRPARLRELYAVMSASPPDLRAFPNPVIVGMVQYLRECTGPDDRVFAAWFVPELYFFAQRGFAAGIVAFFGGHWSEPQFQQQSVAALASHSTPILIFETDYYGAFDAEYPILAQYVHEHYGIAGQTAFGVRGVAANGFTVLADKGRRPTYVHPLTSLPCFW